MINKNELRRLYWDEIKTTRQIADIYNTCHSEILYKMRQYGIPRRDKHIQTRPNITTEHININENLKGYMDGLLLGDGNIQSSRYSGFYRHISINKDWLDNIKDYLDKYNIDTLIYPLKGNNSHMWELRTKSYIEFKTELWDRWYAPIKYDSCNSKYTATKYIPSDVLISPACLANWYLGDGANGSPFKRKKPLLIIATDCFSLDNLEMILNIIYKRYGITIKAYPIHRYNPPKYRLYIYGDNAQKLLGIMSQCNIPKSFYYKFRPWVNIGG